MPVDARRAARGSGRLDAALERGRAAMAAERRDHDRGARLRTRLAAATATWAGSPSGHGAADHTTWGLLTDPATGGPADIRDEADPDEHDRRGTTRSRERRPRAAGQSCTGRSGAGPRERARARAGNWSGATGPGRRARRLAAEAAAPLAWSDAPLPELGSAPPSGTGCRRWTVASRAALVRAVRGERATPSLPARRDPVSYATRGGGRRPVVDRPVRAHARSAVASIRGPGRLAARARTRTVRTTRRPRAVGCPDVASGPRRRSRSADPGTAEQTVDRRGRPGDHRAGQNEAPMGRATSATSGGGSAHTDTGRAVAVGASSASGSLIGDALLRELLETVCRPAARSRPGSPASATPSCSSSIHGTTPQSRCRRCSPCAMPARARHRRRRPGHRGRRRRSPTPLAPTSGGSTVCPRGPVGTVRPRWTGRRRGAPLDAQRHQHNGHGVRPGRTGATDPRAPPQITAGTRVTRRTPGRPGPAHPARVPPRARRGAARSATSDTDGLGLGDLLAGALAAYRSI